MYCSARMTLSFSPSFAVAACALAAVPTRSATCLARRSMAASPELSAAAAAASEACASISSAISVSASSSDCGGIVRRGTRAVSDRRHVPRCDPGRR